MKELVVKIKEIISLLEKETITRYTETRTKSIEMWNSYKADSYKMLRGRPLKNFGVENFRFGTFPSKLFHTEIYCKLCRRS